MKMEFFSEQGVEEVIKKYSNLIDKDFHFDTSGIKKKLGNIQKQASNQCIGGFDILFISDVKGLCNIFDFMNFNKEIEYNFKDFDSITYEK